MVGKSIAEVPGRYAERSPSNTPTGSPRRSCSSRGSTTWSAPPAQSEAFLARSQRHGLPHAYIAFEGEGHGLHQADTMVRALEAELALYAQAFGIEPAGRVPALELGK
ncbi:S9 family peptidase OS=Streptomyces alboniger OX=132473 GN=CP975_30175 PE=4 SV=1 [Streptomyces alboniger]